MATPTSDQGTQSEFFSPRKLLNEAISSITRNFTPSKFTNRMVSYFHMDAAVTNHLPKHFSKNSIEISCLHGVFTLKPIWTDSA